MNDLIDLTAIRAVQEELSRERVERGIGDILSDVMLENQRGQLRSIIIVTVDVRGSPATYHGQATEDELAMIGAATLLTHDLVSKINSRRGERTI